MCIVIQIQAPFMQRVYAIYENKVNNTPEKVFDSDWLRVVQLKCNTSAKRVTLVQKV